MTKAPLSRAIAVVVLASVVLTTAPALAYLKLGFDFDGRRLSLSWMRVPVPYFVSQTSVPGVSTADLQVTVDRAFSTWADVPTSSIAYEPRGIVLALPGQDDGRSTLGFLARPDLDRVLASTSFLVDGTSGELIEADIFFNSVFPWSVRPGGEAGRYDLESVALHEIGHLSGLGHSALGETEFSATGGRRVIAAEAVMFPVAFPAGSTADRTLRPDDIAGISDLYPEAGFASRTGSVSGRVTRSGRGVFGAHVAAFHLGTGALVGNFSLNEDGQFSIAGLAPGPHVLRVEPLDDVDVDAFFPADAPVALDFRVTYPQRIVVVPRGGDSGVVEIEVLDK
jgi:hypothetical protein